MNEINDKATVSLFVNGEQAEAAMERLRDKAEELDAQISAAMEAGDKKTANRLRHELEKVNKELNRTESVAKGAGIVLDELSNSSLYGLRGALKHLQRQLAATKPNTEQWKEYAEQIRTVKNRIEELESKTDKAEGRLTKIWNKTKKFANDVWPIFDIVARGIEYVYSAVSGPVKAYASMDQEMANVRKFTGMTAEQVRNLNGAFMSMDTRTSREDLNKLAQEAGRLGKTSEEDVLGFVRAADKINVALDDLGEGATLTISKLTGVFGDEQRYGTEQAMLKVGSVINELSQNCSASAPYLAQFASRMGGVGAQAKMTIPQIMAFGAVLDSNGQAVEASSTALSQVIVRMMQEPAKYAKVAGLDVQKFTNLLKTDVNGALILFLETLQKSGGMDVLSPMFKDMGENGSRAIAALSTLATHIDDVKRQQVEANKAFEEGTSVIKEYDVQNTTVQASIEKAQKRFQELRIELGQKLSPLMSHLMSSTSAMTRAIKVVVDFCLENKTAIIVLTAAIGSYYVTIGAATVAQKAWNAVVAVGKTAVEAFRYTLGLGRVAVIAFTKGTTAANKAFAALNTTMRANPFGLVLSVVATLTAAFAVLRKRMDETAKARNLLAEAGKKAEAQYGTEILSLETLYKATQNQYTSMEKRLVAVKELQEKYPEYFKNLSTEAILAGDAANAYEKLRQSIIRSAQAKARKDLLAETESDILQVKRERDRKVSEALESVKIPSAEGALYGYDDLGKEAYINDHQDDPALLLVQRVVDEIRTSATKRLRKLEMERESLYDGVAQDVLDGVSDTPTSQESIEQPQGYISEKQAEIERKKKEAEARREAAKARKEFKAELDSYKAQRSAADREVLELYNAGSIDYAELLSRRHANELDYYDDSLSLFERTFADREATYLDDDKDYQKLLLDREKADEKYEQTRIALALEGINRRKEAEEKSAQHMFDVRSNPTVADEIALQAELYRIRREALDEKLALYTEGTKEYADTQYEIEALENDKELALKKLYFKAVSALRKEHDKQSAAEQFEQQKAALDALRDADALSPEKYAAYLKALTEKFKAELPGAGAGARTDTWSKADRKKYEADKAELSKALQSDLITITEFYERLAKLDSEARKKMVEGLKQYGGEWNSMFADIFTSLREMLDSVGAKPEIFLDKLAASVAAVSAAVGAGMQIATEFAEAESRIQLAAIENRYDREIELAQGNSYRVAKLEKKKEAEIARIKSDAAQKEFAMKVLMGIAQTAQNALMAYAAGLSFPFPANTVMPAVLAGIAVAQGAVQVALLKKQQQAAAAQGYSQGGFTKPGAVDEPAGIVHAGEWVASQKLLASPVARPMIEALDYAQRTNTIGSLRAEDVSRSIRANDSLVRIAEDTGSSELIAAVIARSSQSVDALVARLNEPFVTVNTVTGDHGIKQAQDDYARMMNNVTPKSKRK